jgi:hypothetical protein
MPSRKKDIIRMLRFIEKNEPLSFTSSDSLGLDLGLLHKLYSAELVWLDAFVNNETKETEYKGLAIRLSGMIFLSDLERAAHRESFAGEVMPQLEKLLWLIIGALIAVVSQNF